MQRCVKLILGRLSKFRLSRNKLSVNVLFKHTMYEKLNHRMEYGMEYSFGQEFRREGSTETAIMICTLWCRITVLHGY